MTPSLLGRKTMGKKYFASYCWGKCVIVMVCASEGKCVIVMVCASEGMCASGGVC